MAVVRAIHGSPRAGINTPGPLSPIPPFSAPALLWVNPAGSQRKEYRFLDVNPLPPPPPPTYTPGRGREHSYQGVNSSLHTQGHPHRDFSLDWLRGRRCKG